MRRLALLSVLAAAGLTAGLVGGRALADHPTRLVSSTSFADEPSTTLPEPTTTVLPAPSTTVPEPEHPGPSTTVPHPEHPTPPTTRPPARPEPTTTVAPRPEPRELTIGCDSGGGDPVVACHWDGVPDGTTRLVVMRERPGTPSQPLWSTTDTTARDHVDESAEAGVTYVYRVTAYAGDRFLQTSNPERIKAGGGEPAAPAFTMTLACRATGLDAVRCEWGEGPAGTVRYRLVRSIDDRRGRVVAETHDRAANDAAVPAGPQQYYVQAIDSADKVLAVGHAEVDCCTPGDR
ncbi:MAG: hypothetical protein JWO68_2200 [Actinomycetia bacterium]|nr:hypothetical protein [Actinomycetes bacterium]